MQTNKNIPYYVAALGLFVLLKFGFRFADNEDLVFLLKPTDTLVGILTGSKSVYWANEGYFHGKLNVLIDKSCSGFNFWVLCFGVFAYLGIRYAVKTTHRALSLPAALLFAYLLTVFVNTSRIFVSLALQSHMQSVLGSRQHLVHEGIGILTNLSFLILAFYVAEKLLKQKLLKNQNTCANS